MNIENQNIAPGELDVTGTLEAGDWSMEQEEAFFRSVILDAQKRHPQSWMKRMASAGRRMNLMIKRENTNNQLGIDLVAENTHPHGSRAIRRKVSHDARKGTKPGLFGRGSVKLADADLVELHGRSALAVLSEDRFRKALDELNAAGRRLDLRAKSAFQKTVEALSEVMGTRVLA